MRECVGAFSGDGNGLGSASSVTGSYSDGYGNRVYPMITDLFVNNIWKRAHIWWDAPNLGFPKRAEPWFLRSDHLDFSNAKVSLRVVTTSFAYAIPTNYIAWGDGPAGALTPADDATILWDNANKGAGTRMSLSGGNAFAVAQGTGEFPTMGYVMSINFAGLTGKRYVEFQAGSSTTTWCADNNSSWEMGLIDSTQITLTGGAGGTISDAIIHMIGSSVFKRGAPFPVASLTSVHSPPVGGNINEGAIIGGMVIDFDNRLMWWMTQSANYGVNKYQWMGFKTAATWTGERATPFTWGPTAPAKGIPISITASAAQVLRIFARLRMDYFHSPQPISLKINASGPFYGYPLLPGIRSLNGGRSVQAGQGDSWDVVNNPASATYGASGLIIMPRYNGAAQCAQVKFAGKKYFEIYSEGDSALNGSTWDWSIGLRRDSATTLTWGVGPAPANVLDNALMAHLGGSDVNSKICRYGVTISWSTTLSLAGAITFVNSPMIGVAVDFDAGKIWFGRWSGYTNQMFWSGGGDPATGVNPHATFTASQSLRIFMTFALLGESQQADLGRYILIQDDNNVMGKPSGFTTWGGTAPTSNTATPSGTGLSGGGIKNIWPFGIMN